MMADVFNTSQLQRSRFKKVVILNVLAFWCKVVHCVFDQHPETNTFFGNNRISQSHATILDVFSNVRKNLKYSSIILLEATFIPLSIGTKYFDHKRMINLKIKMLRFMLNNIQLKFHLVHSWRCQIRIKLISPHHLPPITGIIYIKE